MSAAQPSLPGNGVSLRLRRDDGVTYVGVTVPSGNYTLGALAAKLAAAPGLSAPEIARAQAAVPTLPRQPHEPFAQGNGWLAIDFPPTRQFYLLRDDGTNLSWQAPPPMFTLARAVAAITATAGLTANELARLASVNA